ncbi:MAG: molecular chaperone DnaK, partial [Aquabacterium sp.]
HPRLPGAVTLIDQVFGTQSQAVDARTVRQLRARLEQLLGARETWDLPLLRALFDALWARMRRRRRSAEHERVWLNLAGYCLRPGLGAPLDPWRIEQVWPLFEQGIQYTQDSNNWSEWWTLWRRAAGGLDSAQQLQLLEVVGEHLMSIQHARRDKDPLQNSYDDMVRLVASLERVPAAYRVEVGNWLVQRLQKTGDKPHTWWAVGRLGARISLYGNAENVVPPETASTWLQALLALDWKAVDHAAFAATTLARMSGDRVRDVPAELREAVVQRLQAIRAPATWSEMVRDVVELDEADQKRSFGEALPVGLRLLVTA